MNALRYRGRAGSKMRCPRCRPGVGPPVRTTANERSNCSHNCSHGDEPRWTLLNGDEPIGPKFRRKWMLMNPGELNGPT